MSARGHFIPLLAGMLALACADSSGPAPHGRDANGADGAGALDASSAAARDAEAGAKTTDAGRKPRVPCDQRTGALRGKTLQTVQAGGRTRSFVLYAPSSLDPKQPVPVVVVAHGYTQTAEQMVAITNYGELAEREGFVVLFPEGQPGQVGPWNVGSGACPSSFGFLPVSSNDDQAFLDQMLELVEDDQCLDRDHVFVTGFSMGGYLANQTGCLRGQVRAIAPHSAGSRALTDCPVKRKPVILFHGTDDRLIPLSCGLEARERWAERNGCSKEVDVMAVMGGSCEYNKGCPEGGQVAMCKFDGMNHGWAGGPDVQVVTFPGPYQTFERASELSWKFFKTHAW